MLTFKGSLPSFLQNSNAEKFAEVLDKLNEYKQVEIANSLRIYNPILVFDSKWLIKRLTDYGFHIPTGYPWQPLQQILLNIYNILGLKGTANGLKLMLSVLTLGEVTLDTSKFNRAWHYISPDDENYGFITGDNSELSQLYLVNGTDDFTPNTSLGITIKTTYSDNTLVKNYVESLIPSWVPMAESVKISTTWTKRDGLYFSDELNNYFK